jgi:glycosyltransferase involved in cell wall biosynthesis
MNLGALSGRESMNPLQEGKLIIKECAPLVSVVIPCFNHGNYILDAIESVAAQTFDDYEIIVVNDGSTDHGTIVALHDIAASGIQVLHTSNRGPAEARNHGIRHARGKYILPLDADDKIAPHYLELAAAVLERDEEVGVVYGKIQFFGELVGEWQQPEYCPNRILIENMIVVSGVFRRTDWRLVGGYRQNMRHGWEDWDFWLAFVELKRKIVKLPEVVFYYRIRKDSRTRTLSLIRNVWLFMQLVRNHPRLYLANSRSFLGLLMQLVRIKINKQFLLRS